MVVADRLKEPAIAGVADQRLVALGELPLQRGEDRGAVGGVLPRLLMVAADDVALAAQRHRLGLVVGLLAVLRHRERHERGGIAEHQFAHHLVGALAHPEDVQEAARLQLGHSLGADHAAVGDHAHAGDGEAPP